MDVEPHAKEEIPAETISVAYTLELLSVDCPYPEF
jgi:hypothetical protein